MKSLGSGFMIAILFLVSAAGLEGQALRNMITFDNQSGEPAVVKLVGPTGRVLEVSNGEKLRVNVAAGEYYLLARYGADPKRYTYSRGDPFKVQETATQYSVITITLHKVVGGNYPSRPASAAEFERASMPSIPPAMATSPPGARPSEESANRGDATKAGSIHEPPRERDSASGPASTRTRVFRVVVDERYFEAAFVRLPFRNTAERILKLAGIGVITRNEVKHDSLLRVTVSGSAISRFYSGTHPGTYFTGAELSGTISFEAEGASPLRRSFSAKVAPPQQIFGTYKTSQEAPWFGAFVLAFPGALLQAMMEVYGIDVGLAALKDPDKIVRFGAVRALGEMRNEAAIPFLITALEDGRSGSDLKVGATAVSYVSLQVPAALKKIGRTPAGPLLTILSRESDQGFSVSPRSLAAEILGDLKDPTAVEPLLAALSDKNWAVRTTVVEALRKIGDARALERLREVSVGDKDRMVREAAAAAVEGIVGAPR